jgi:hypothetical protein
MFMFLTADLAGINDIKRDLHATDNDISLSLAIFTLVQGSLPLIWSAVSEIKGRKVSQRVIHIPLL